MFKSKSIKYIWWGVLVILWSGSILTASYIIPRSFFLGLLGFLSAIPPIVFWPVYLLAGFVPWRTVRLSIRGILVASLILDDFWGIVARWS